MGQLGRFRLLVGCLFWFGLGSAAVSFAETAKWKIDPDHSTIGFQVPHMVVSKTNEKLTGIRGWWQWIRMPKSLQPLKPSFRRDP